MPVGVYKRVKGRKYGNQDHHHSASAKKKMRLSHLKNPTKYWQDKKMPKAMRMKMRKAKLGKKPWNAGLTRKDDKRIAQPWLGKKRDPETVEKVRRAHLGTRASEETKEKMRRSRPDQTGPKNPAWNGGSSFVEYPLGWNRTFTEQIRYRDKYTCQICGVHEADCVRKLHVHHKDYNKKNISTTNLVSLCHSCHSKTNFNRKYWKAYFNG